MIITTKDGRKKSVITPEELSRQASAAVSDLTEEELELLAGLVNGDEEFQLEATDEMLSRMYHTTPVSMAQFIEDPYYLGESCQTLYPQLRQDLIDLFDHPYREVVLTGGIGVGKTYSLSIALCRVLYELSCLTNPQKVFGLSSGTEIVIPLISKNLFLARDVMKTAIDDKIKESPYFMSQFTPKFSKETTLFPNNIKVIIGSYVSERVLGTNVISVGLDECVNGESLLNILTSDGGCVTSMTVGDLWAMGSEERAGYKIVGFDHGTNEVRSGWFRIKESTIQPLVEIGTAQGCISPSLEHPVLVRRGGWLVYGHAKDIRTGDFVVMEGDGGSRGVDKVGSEHEFVGVRPERTRVEDLPSGLRLAEVISTKELPPEQTYSICTEFETFIADGFVVHNTNFPPTRKAQQITTGFGKKRTAAHFDVVEKVYRGLERRIKSRFLKNGGDFPGMLVLASSAATLESFTERKMRDSANKPEVFVRDHTPWTVKPEGSFCGEKFWVICSTSSLRARILDESEYDSITDEWLEENEAWLLDVPVEYRSDFEVDIENALRDIAGISTQAVSAFIQRVDMVDKVSNERRSHPFSMYEWTAGGTGEFKWKEMCRPFERRLPGGYTEEGWAPILNPNALRWGHLDVSLSGDSSGFCVGHVDRWVEVVRRDGDGNRYTDLAPFYVIDLMLRINPPQGEQIYFPDLRRLVYALMAHGYKFMGFSTDTYMYAEMHQQLKRKGIRNVQIISMDTSVEPYNELKSAIYEERIDYYKYEPFIEELKALEYDRVAGKIDHPVAGSKDCLSGDTKISLLNGTEVPISELCGKDFWVYSCTPEGSIVPGRATNVHWVGDRDVMRIWFDNGEWLDCTPDHEIMMRDGTFREADKVSVGDSIMPLYRRLSSANPRHGLDGYEQVLDNKTGRYGFTHQLVAIEANGFRYAGEKGKRVVVHHVDFNKRNNDPENLKSVGWDEHLELHREVASENMRRLWNDAEFVKEAKKRSSRLGKKTGKKNITKYNKSKERVEKLRANGVFSANGKRVMRRLWNDPEFREQQLKRLRGSSNPYARKDVTFERIMNVAEKSVNQAEMLETLGCTQKVLARVLRENGLVYRDIAERFGHTRGARRSKSSNFRFDVTIDRVREVAKEVSSVAELCCVLKCTNKVYGRVLRENGINVFDFGREHFPKYRKNHRVIRVDRSVGVVPVYDMTVEKYHNFAVSSGVFVHNCSDSVAGTVQGLCMGAKMLPIGAGEGRHKKLAHEHDWVSTKIPIGQLDMEEVISAADEDDADFMPIMFGD